LGTDVTRSTGGTAVVFTVPTLGGSTSSPGSSASGSAAGAYGGATPITSGGTSCWVESSIAVTTLVSQALCGNGLLEYSNGEQCDDGNQLPGDGCSSMCGIEPNWNCPPCGPCIVTIVCGDGVIGAGEVCDDRNTLDGDGCSSTCKEQDDTFVCTPGRPCISKLTCGNGVLDPGEECDPEMDASTNDAGGAAACTSGCTLVGYCGDGEVQEGEECDEGASNALGCNGCTSTCTLGPYCGDGVVQRQCGEVCDDGINAGGYNSCGPGCTAAGAHCGDGIVQSEYGEECDEGILNGTGSSKCTAACKLYYYPVI
jgi:cysteine-rich repeat protein